MYIPGEEVKVKEKEAEEDSSWNLSEECSLPMPMYIPLLPIGKISVESTLLSTILTFSFTQILAAFTLTLYSSLISLSLL
jgi:hypothetical protein